MGRFSIQRTGLRSRAAQDGEKNTHLWKSVEKQNSNLAIVLKELFQGELKLKTVSGTKAGGKNNDSPDSINSEEIAEHRDSFIRVKSDILEKHDSEIVEKEPFTIAEIHNCTHGNTNQEKACKECIEELYAVSRNLIDVIADDIEKCLVENCDEAEHEFSSQVIPKISLNDYLFRCVKYMDKWFKDTPGVKSSGMRSLVASLIYVERLKEALPEMKVTKYNIHRIFMVTMLLAAKFAEDIPIHNSYWSRVGGVPVEELNKFESAFCSHTKFNLFVEKELLQMKYEEYHP
mmetsp:Transcript_28384/g.34660  ORF Transcript_28384/g.34660 Transcript_28384/m.34660 type:complete len:289 (+) Transcript_28384:55-921(+)